MAHLGRNLLPTWPILRPSWAHLRPNFAKNLHQIAPGISRSAPRHPKTTQRVAKGLQDSPGAQIFMVLGSILDLIFLVFPSVSPSILHGLLASSSARWRLGARSALDIFVNLFVIDYASIQCSQLLNCFWSNYCDVTNKWVGNKFFWKMWMNVLLKCY